MCIGNVVPITVIFDFVVGIVVPMIVDSGSDVGNAVLVDKCFKVDEGANIGVANRNTVDANSFVGFLGPVILAADGAFKNVVFLDKCFKVDEKVFSVDV